MVKGSRRAVINSCQVVVIVSFIVHHESESLFILDLLTFFLFWNCWLSSVQTPNPMTVALQFRCDPMNILNPLYVVLLLCSPLLPLGPRKSCVGSMKHVLAHMTYFYLKPPSWSCPGLLPVALAIVDLACCNVH